MKPTLLTLFFLSTQFTFAQNFTERLQPIPFLGIDGSVIAFADIDNDNDQDVVASGLDLIGNSTTKLYINNGKGHFSEKASPIEQIVGGDIAFVDVDGDNDQDLFITGQEASLSRIAKLYLNDGQGNFTETNSSYFHGIINGSIAFADVDNDNDQDLLITGRSSNGPISKLYINDGTGVFTEMSDTSFLPVVYSSVAFADVDNDNDIDVLIAGDHNSMSEITKLYINDGTGHFTQMSDTPFEDIYLGDINFTDIDGDNDQDLLITGRGSAGDVAKLYTNDGLGNFTEIDSPALEGVDFSSVAFADIDNDNDQDLVISGKQNSSDEFTKLYNNDGAGNFTEVSPSPFHSVWNGSIAFADINNDNNLDLIITGTIDSEGTIYSEAPTFKLYTNNGLGEFKELEHAPIQATRIGAIALADVDNDSDQDLVVSGLISSSKAISNLYINDGEGDFSRNTSASLTGVFASSIAFADIDGDNDQDLFISGKNLSEAFSLLYTNDGEGNFTEVLDTPFEAVEKSSVAFADVDGDNDQDLFIIGESMYSPISKLYINDGLGNFTEVLDTPFQGFKSGAIAFADVDGDNDQDLLITGISMYVATSKLYINDGLGGFTEALDTPFEAVDFSSVIFTDIDGDSDQDLLIAGSDSSNNRVAILYTNDGEGNFTEVTNTAFENISVASIAFGDVDNDNDQDLLITGEYANNFVSKLYLNDGSGHFIEIEEVPFEGMKNCYTAFADTDNDNDQDLIMIGLTSDGYVSKLYTNNGLISFVEEPSSRAQLDFTVYPNPIQSNVLNIRYHSTKNGSIKLKIFNQKGILMLQQEEAVLSGQQNILINIASLSSGSYFIQLDNGEINGSSKFIFTK